MTNGHNYHFGDYDFVAKSYDLLRKKEKWVAEQVQLKAENEIKDCTFKPDIIHLPGGQLDDKENAVKGLERFYMLRDLQKRKETMKEQRQREVFRDGSKF